MGPSSYEPGSAWLFDAHFHVDVALNQAEILANLIGQEMSLGDMVTLLKLKRGRYSLVSEPIAAGARPAGVALKDLALHEAFGHEVVSSTGWGATRVEELLTAGGR